MSSCGVEPFGWTTAPAWGSFRGLSTLAAASGSSIRGPSALALVAGSMDGLEVVYGAGTAVSDTHDVIDLDSALVFREHPAAEPAETVLHLHEQRFEPVVVRALADASAPSLASVESVHGPAVGLGHARNVPRACDRGQMLAGVAVRELFARRVEVLHEFRFGELFGSRHRTQLLEAPCLRYHPEPEGS